MSGTSSRARDEGAVPLRRSAAEEEDHPVHGDDGTAPKVTREDPVPLRLGAERVEIEERAARLRIVSGSRPRRR
jgi:hypothetical protein